jgi:hypothetical protein
MKLRIHKDSIRFRFTGGEAAALASGNVPQESLALGPLPGQSLTCRVTPDAGASDAACIHAQFEDNRPTVPVPPPARRTWQAGEQLAIGEVPVWSTGKLRILLE